MVRQAAVRSLRRAPVALVLFALSLAPCRAAASPKSVLRLVSADGQSRTLRQDEIGAMRHQTIKVTGEKGAPTSYQGVPVKDLLEMVGTPFGAKLRGPQMRLYVLVEGSDGYAAVFALAEFDPGFTNQPIVLADRRDGRSLTIFEGPFRMVVAGDKRHARWVRKVVAIEVRRAN